VFDKVSFVWLNDSYKSLELAYVLMALISQATAACLVENFNLVILFYNYK